MRHPCRLSQQFRRVTHPAHPSSLRIFIRRTGRQSAPRIPRFHGLVEAAVSSERHAEQAPVEADLVMPIPDSGTPAAIGFAKRSGLPYEEGLIKNRYVGRTFIEPDQALRSQGIKLKFNPLAEIEGRRLVIVDDSIVRGNTMRALVEMLQAAGAADVHVRISSPPVVSPCFYGIDMADEDELAAAHRSVEEMREHIAATSLAYLSLDGMQWATNLAGESVCRACFTRSYPTAVPPERTAAKHRFEGTAVRA